MMHIAGDLVLPLDKAGNGKSKDFRIPGFRDGWAWTPRQWTAISEDTGVGDPRRATATTGEKFLDHLTDMLADFFVDFAGSHREDLYES